MVFDGNFIAVMLLKLKQDPAESVRRVLQDSECTFIVPKAVLNELRLLAKNKAELAEVARYAEQFLRKEHELNSQDDNIPAADCLREIVGSTNASKLFVATQDVCFVAAETISLVGT